MSRFSALVYATFFLSYRNLESLLSAAREFRDQLLVQINDIIARLCCDSSVTTEGLFVA